MTFGQAVKKELCKVNIAAECCALCELAGILHTAGSVIIAKDGLQIEVNSDCEQLKDRTESILQRLYGSKIDVQYLQMQMGKESFRFLIDKNIASAVLTDCGIMRYNEGTSLFSREIDSYLFLDGGCVGAFLRGAFLGGGAISIPHADTLKGSFYLQISHESQEFILSVKSVIEQSLSQLSLQFGLVTRQTRYALYLKRKESISDFLCYLGAQSSVLELMNVMIMREMRCSANRSANCINANINKSVSNGVKQAHMVKELKKHKKLEQLPKKVQEAALLRLKNPEASLEELAERLGLSKSGVKHRLEKMQRLYEQTLG